MNIEKRTLALIVSVLFSMPFFLCIEDLNSASGCSGSPDSVQLISAFESLSYVLTFRNKTVKNIVAFMFDRDVTYTSSYAMSVTIGEERNGRGCI